jgi:hypothetical protein
MTRYSKEVVRPSGTVGRRSRQTGDKFDGGRTVLPAGNRLFARASCKAPTGIEPVYTALQAAA